MNKTLRIAFAVVLLLIAVTLLIGRFIEHEIDTAMHRRVPLERDTLVVIKPGSNAVSIGRELEVEGWLSHYRWFALRARLDGVAGRIKAGTYELAPGDTLADFLRRIVNGETKTFDVSFIEGQRFADIRRTLRAAPYVRSSLVGLDERAVLAALDISAAAPEGLFFPASYRYEVDTPDRQILRRAYHRMQSVLTELWAERAEDLPYETPYEALIMASIVEKETGRAEERRAIAGVFVRRLRLGMKLQTDPTVIYGLGDAFDGDLTRADLHRDTPYNTYTRSGLPPTPIALPGRAAIAAALDPAPGKTLYFVAKGDGTHHFSETLAAHNRAVRRYQLRR